MADPMLPSSALPSLFLGASLGLASGVSPGPLSALVLSSTLERGLAAGLRIAVAPLATDLLMLATASLILTRLGPGAFAALGVVGGGVVIFLGLSTLQQSTRTPSLKTSEAPSRPMEDLLKGAAVNLLNPHAWLFWMVVGGPAVHAAWAMAPARAILFFSVFEGCLVAAKAGLAGVIAHQRHRLLGNGYRWTLRILGALLLFFGGQLLWQGFIHAK